MSCYFQTGDLDLWNPSNSVARLFLAQAGVLAEFVGLPSGLAGIVDDECEVDPEVFEPFVRELIDRHDGSVHPVLRGMLEGFIIPAAVMVERGGGRIPVSWSDRTERASGSMTRG
ncbi:hypothetical protein GCM10010441_77900 [Kitasatospora paracochleata]|uniref:Uncharacterized protein n=1 Tax=Kitasatospora paracochleata TaxID=58354 RepID=A0ABT1IXN7_9ACTN|nr:DUF6086 family protein [Kitasatospora paracochleata]MCP2309917.1 hypothetical protein [Kitasatospora paracochleata]